MVIKSSCFLKLRKIGDKMSTEEVASLFDGWEEALIWSGLQGCMGTLIESYYNKQVRKFFRYAIKK